jgi:DNA invertase Pin-like site-specific DNA recombinase
VTTGKNPMAKCPSPGIWRSIVSHDQGHAINADQRERRILRERDQLVVCKLDRFARSLEHAIRLERCIGDKGASLLILDPAIDNWTSMGRLMCNMISTIAEFERSIMLDRQRDGIAAAQAGGKYVGRQPTARRKAAEVRALKAEGLGASEIARRLGVGVASVYRILKAD